MNWTSCSFPGMTFLLERMTDRQITVNLTWGFGWVSLSLQRKQLAVFVANNKIWAFKQSTTKKLKFIKSPYHRKFDIFPRPEAFSDEMGNSKRLLNMCIYLCVIIYICSVFIFIYMCLHIYVYT